MRPVDDRFGSLESGDRRFQILGTHLDHTSEMILMVFCHKCGAELPEDADFCPKCGVRTRRGVETGATTSWAGMKDEFYKIGEELEKAFTEAGKEIEKAFKSARKSIRETIGEGTVICSQCGQKNQKEAKFCYSCGEKL